MRPTGRLHIGNYFGALQNWVKLQEDASNECFFFIADWHSLTSDYADTSQIAQNSIEIATDFLAAGLDPKKVVIFQQSQVIEHAELHLLLSMITPLGWLERVPTYKEQIENIKGKDLHTYGFLGYPVLQTADIVIYGEEGMSLAVPVGEDQVAHVELSREVVRHFNLFNGEFIVDESLRQENQAWQIGAICHALQIPADEFGLKAFPLSDDTWAKFVGAVRGRFLAIGFSNALELLARESQKADRRVKLAVGDRESDAKILGTDPEPWKTVKVVPVLVEPDVLLTEAKRVPGLDGRKMSKSYGNAIELGESDESIRVKTKAMITDPARKRRTDPGNPDICPVFDWHKLFSPAETLSWASVGCKTAGIGCIECKHEMANNLIKWIVPIRARRLEFAAEPGRVLEVIDAGSDRARETAQATMKRVREAVFGWNAKRASISGTDAEQRGAGD
jgi:tryptophanyl-tRNA synthetase